MVSQHTPAGPASQPVPEDSRSRRQLLMGGGTAALGAAALLSGCGKAASPAQVIIKKHSPEARRDVQILNVLLDVEYRAIAAYTASVPLLAAFARQEAKAHKARHPAPKPTPAKMKKKKKRSVPLSTSALFAPNAAAQFLGQEIDHTNELKGTIKGVLGGKPAKPAPSYDLVNPNPSSKRDVLLILQQIEQAQLEAYLKAVTELSPGALKGTAASICANHAQHLMVLRMELGLAAIPSAFVTGQE